MSIPSQKVELNFDLSFGGGGVSFVLDDPVKGELDNTQYTLGGGVFVDVTDKVKSISIARGRADVFSSYPAGQATVEFNNHDRSFDPLYANSPYAGNIIPRREIRISSGNIVQFSGWIEDWDLTYTANGDSVAAAYAIDALSILSLQTLSAGTPTVQSAGARINAILDSAPISWPSNLRDIDTGEAQMGSQPIEDNTRALTYLQTVAASEGGDLFINKTGDVAFRSRAFNVNNADIVNFGGTGIPFGNLEVTYGSEQLYNEIVIQRQLGGTATIVDANSQLTYGARNLTLSGLFMSTDQEAVDLGVYLAERYSEPEYNISGLEVYLHKLELDEQQTVLDLDIGSICRVQFTPNGIGDPIDQFVRIIRVEHTVTPDTHFVTFGLAQISGASLILDDPEFGKLDGKYLLGAAYNPWIFNDPIYGRLSAGMAVS